MQKLWRAGFKLYSPNINLIYHLWERQYRPTFAQDQAQSEQHRESHRQNIERVRELVLNDAEFVSHMGTERGVDLTSKKGSEKANCGGLDPQYF